MQTKQILSADVLDILFDGRNKEYGAYELRKTYNRRIVWALIGTVLLCLLFLMSTILARGKKESIPTLVKDIELSALKPDVPKPDLAKQSLQPQLKVKQTQPQAPTIRNVVPVIVPDPDVKPQDEMKTIDELITAKIGLVDNVNGGTYDGTITPPQEGSLLGGKGDDGIKAINGEGDVFIPVQVEAEFPGGKAAWIKYLERNLNSGLPAENGAPAGKYSVVVSFMVDANGNISDVVAENDPGYGAKEEAIRIIKKGPKWRPAIQNGRTVAYRVKQPITFQVNVEQ